ncbi:MAG: type II secretion system F family protein [Nitrososphaerota archaeon]|nr:type II secretion system F family protein [Nitrososphaerota archaeon]MDG6923889.1 type II secretion system F family protein [Nitrososphaerota archaeon]
MRYIEDQWKYASYVGAAIIVIVSFILAISVGKYHVVLPYLVPYGSATRASGTTWTLFNRPWELPNGSSASLTDTILGVGLMTALSPVALVTYNNHRFLKTVERSIPRFMRDLLESTNSGVILPRALIQATTRDYGPISHEIAIAMTKFSMGYDFKLSIMSACERLRHPFMLQVGQIVVEAYSAGGKMRQVLESSVVLFNGMEQYDQQKQSELRPYTQLVYISVVIFLIIAYIIVSRFIGPLNNLPIPPSSSVGLPVAVSSFSVGVSNIPPVYFESVFFISGLLESIFGGIVVGKIVDASASTGLRHSLVLLVITILAFNAPIFGIFNTI